MRTGSFFSFLAVVITVLWAGLSSAGAEPYSKTSSPESRYDSYRKSLDGDAPKSTLYNRKDSSSYSPPPKILNLKQILNSDGAAKYGMQTRSATAPVPYGAGAKGPKPPPSAAEMQEMARRDRELTVQNAVAESNARLARIQRMQAELYGQSNYASPPAGVAGQPEAPKKGVFGRDGKSAPPVRYTYRKTDPTRVQAPPRVFQSDR